MAAVKLSLAGRTYNKTTAGQRCQEILRGPRQTPLEGDDAEFLYALLLNHPEAEAKIGPGISYFTVEPTMYGAVGFYAHRVDGSSTDWSYKKALTPPSQAQYARAAMRHEVQDQIFAYRDTAFAHVDRVQCPISGEWVEKLSCHIDHTWPITFLHLADNWVSTIGGYDLVRHESTDRQAGRRLIDPEQREAWRVYHAERAQLRVVSPDANVGTLNRLARHAK